MNHKTSRLACLVIVMITSNAAFASFGSTVVVSPVTVSRIYQGTGLTYVTFSGTTLPGCANNGGYLRPTWASANGGAVDHEMANRMLAVLLAGKAQDLSMEVRFRVNSAGTGWDSCSIDGLYLF